MLNQEQKKLKNKELYLKRKIEKTCTKFADEYDGISISLKFICGYQKDKKHNFGPKMNSGFKSVNREKEKDVMLEILSLGQRFVDANSESKE